MEMKPLKEWREEQELSLRALAEKSGVHFTTISEIEQGSRRPHVQTSYRLARALGVKMPQIEESRSRPAQEFTPPQEKELELLASPEPSPDEPAKSETQELHEDMLGLLRSMAAYLVRVGRARDVQRVLRTVLRDAQGGRR